MEDTKNLTFHALLELETQKINYGQITVNVVIKDEVALIDSMKVTRSTRIRYNVQKNKDIDKKDTE